MEQRESGQELVKCVLVGDTAVGKTRLICAQIRSAPTSLRQLLTTHVPTVWAIDQYRMYKEVMERSMTVVDGVQVSLRLWDTFGDHEKDRKFAYGRSDVILLCFSIGSRSSLIHCKTMWYPEIRRFCPYTPVLLVGCKNDLRFLIRDPAYIDFCRDRSPFVRPIRESDLVMPEEARAIAKDLGIPYYETSIYTYYGATEVFENAIRAALIARRNQRFWMTNLKQIRQPLLQAPYCPPKNEYTNIEVFPGEFHNDLKKLFSNLHFPDLIFVLGEDEISAHRFIVAIGARKLLDYLEFGDYSPGRRVSEISTESSESSSDETQCLLKNVAAHMSGCDNTMFSEKMNMNFDFDGLCSAIQSVSLRETDDDLKLKQVVLEMSDKISYEAMKAHLHFLYTGELCSKLPPSELFETAELLETPELSRALHRIIESPEGSVESLGNKQEENSYIEYLKSALWSECSKEDYTDVMFHLEDGAVAAHRAMLMARSDVMKAMFSQDFLERRSHVVSLPGVKTETFKHLLNYFYTDSIEPVRSVETGILLIELANRLCLPRLVNLLEKSMIQDLAQKLAKGVDVTTDFIKLLEPAQWYNATQISEWCLNQLASNFSKFSVHSKLFKELSTENRQRILQNRWPPVWYIKEFDYYQKSTTERNKAESQEKKARKRNSSGCLMCFSSKARKDEYNEVKPKNKSRQGSYNVI